MRTPNDGAYEDQPPPYAPGRCYVVTSSWFNKHRGSWTVALREPDGAGALVTPAFDGDSLVRAMDGRRARVAGIMRFRNLRGTITGDVVVDVELRVGDEVELVREERR